MVDGRKQRVGGHIINATFDSYRTLTCSRNTHAGINLTANTRFQTEPGKTGNSKNYCGVLAFVKFSQACINIAPQFLELQVGIGGLDLQNPAQAGRTHTCTFW